MGWKWVAPPACCALAQMVPRGPGTPGGTLLWSLGQWDGPQLPLATRMVTLQTGGVAAQKNHGSQSFRGWCLPAAHLLVTSSHAE